MRKRRETKGILRKQEEVQCNVRKRSEMSGNAGKFQETSEALFLDVAMECHDPQTGVQAKV